MEILKQFGFEPQLFFAQIVNFLILAYVFKRFLYKPILGVLKEREEKVKKSLEDAQKTSQILTETEEQRNSILRKTRLEAESILMDAKKIAQEERSRVLDTSKKEADKIIKEAKSQANMEMEYMEKKIGIISLDLSQKILNKILLSLFSQQEKETIMKKAFKKLDNEIKYE